MMINKIVKIIQYRIFIYAFLFIFAYFVDKSCQKFDNNSLQHTVQNNNASSSTSNNYQPFSPREIQTLKKHASQGDLYAQFKLGFLYSHKDYAEKGYKEAIKWYIKAANQGCVEAQYNLGVIYELEIKNYKDAIKWYAKAATQTRISFKLCSNVLIFR